MAYGVATNNIFALLDEENEDPQALASKTVEDDGTSVAKKEPTPKAKEVPKTAGALRLLTVPHLWAHNNLDAHWSDNSVDAA